MSYKNGIRVVREKFLFKITLEKIFFLLAFFGRDRHN